MSIQRTEIYKEIDRERDYQDSLGEDRTDGRVHTVGEEMILMETYLRRAFDAWTNSSGDTKALHEIRKVVTLGVRCMENNGLTFGILERKGLI